MILLCGQVEVSNAFLAAKSVSRDVEWFLCVRCGPDPPKPDSPVDFYMLDAEEDPLRAWTWGPMRLDDMRRGSLLQTGYALPVVMWRAVFHLFSPEGPKPTVYLEGEPASPDRWYIQVGATSPDLRSDVVWHVKIPNTNDHTTNKPLSFLRYHQGRAAVQALRPLRDAQKALSLEIFKQRLPQIKPEAMPPEPVPRAGGQAGRLGAGASGSGAGPSGRSGTGAPSKPAWQQKVSERLLKDIKRKEKADKAAANVEEEARAAKKPK